ncbi:MAG: metallophosphoesterase [Planctomycetes bacterium]|nr:metallophosphoesterase [Planctomycetota bacterium]
MAHPAAEIFATAARQNRDDKHRQGNLLLFGSGEHLIVSGDIHGNRSNLAKIIHYAALSANPARVLVLQEIIHSTDAHNGAGDRSFELLLRAARLKNRHPNQVCFLMANHDLAQMTGNDITKNGCGACKAFNRAVAEAYGEDAGEIIAAMNEFFCSQPLAAKCPNGVLLSHSLPSPERLKLFDPAVFDRPYRPEDFFRGRSVYELTWGRRHNQAMLDEFADLLGIEVFINAHQPLPQGYVVNGRQLLIASDHGQGVIVEFDAEEEIRPDMLSKLVKPIAAL